MHCRFYIHFSVTFVCVCVCVTFVNAAGNVSSVGEEGCNAEFLWVSWGEQEEGLDCCLCQGKLEAFVRADEALC